MFKMASLLTYMYASVIGEVQNRRHVVNLLHKLNSTTLVSELVLKPCL